MKKILLSLIFIIIFVYLFSENLFTQQTPPDKWKEPRIYHTDFDKNFEKNIILSREKIKDKDFLKNYSPNNAYWFSLKEPDFSKNPPWSTEIFIYNERDYLIKIKIFDHKNTLPEVKWINEKILYIEIWWGRVLGTYLIFDVEKENIILREMINDGNNLYWQYKENNIK